MIKEMRRSDRQLQENEAFEVLKNGEYGMLSTMGIEYPYGVPVNYVVIDNCIYIHGCTDLGLKTENIALHENVCFTVVGKTKVLSEKFSESYESTIAFGKAHIASEEKKEMVLEAFIDKYSKEFKEKGLNYISKAKDKVLLIEITIEHYTGKARR